MAGGNQQPRDETNRFTLFRNKKKQAGDTKPDYTGKVNVNGVEYWLNAWVQSARSGEKYMSGTIRPVEDPGAYKPAPAPPQSPSKDAGRPQVDPEHGAPLDRDDDIPF